MAADGEGPVVQNDWVVSLDYELRFDDGELATSSEEDGRLSFIQGRGHVFPVLEAAVQGLRVGDEAELEMAPEDAYGEYNEEAVELLPFDLFPPDMEILEGVEVELLDEETGAEMDAIVTAVQADGVLVDLNHPLAGEALTMWLRVAEVRPATEEELEHDHVHNDDGAHDDTHGQGNGSGW